MYLFKKYLFIYFWLRWVLITVHGIFIEACGLLSSRDAEAPEHVASVVGGMQA